MRLCSVDGCDRRHHARGFCPTHLRRVRRGLPVTAPVLDNQPATLLRRLARRSTYTPSGCLVWTGATTPNGYGSLGPEASGERLVHRAAYALLVGPVPAGLDLDHLCRVRECWRVQHLEPVTRSVNLTRGAESRRALA